jgi:hypothetical protein
VRWRPNRRKEAWASSSPRGVNGGGVSVESGGRKKGGKALVTGNSPRWSPDDRGALRAVGVARERREEKRGLSAFCAEATHAPGGGKGGSSMGAPRRGERGGVRHGRNAQQGMGPVEQKPVRGRDGGVRATQVTLARSRGGRHRQVGQLGGWGPDAEIEKKGERVTGGPGFLNLTQIQ